MAVHANEAQSVVRDVPDVSTIAQCMTSRHWPIDPGITVDLTPPAQGVRAFSMRPGAWRPYLVS